MHVFRSLLCFCLLATAALAQTVRWERGDSGDPADLQLVFTDCAPDGTPSLPPVTNGTLRFAGQSEQTSIINFSMTRSVILSYRLQVKQAGAAQIPAFRVKTNKGELSVAAYDTGTVQPGPEADVRATLAPAKDTVWAGEVFPVNYDLDVARRSFSNFGGPIEWDPSPLLAEDWSDATAAQVNRSGEIRLEIQQKTRAFAKTPGSYTLKPLSRLLNLVTGTVGFGLFQQQRVDQVTSTTNRPELTVKPLPLPAPAGFSGAVGQLKLTSKVVPVTAAVGEPITWTLELTGTANWPDIAGLPSREVSKDFQVISPQAKRTPAEGKLFDNTLSEDVVLVPTKPGTYTLGSVDFVYFDPATGRYQSIKTPATTVTVTAAAPRFNVTPPAGETTSTPAAAATPEVKAPAAAANPTGLPRDPIEGRAITATPFAATASLVWSCLAPLALTLLGWLALAVWHAKRHDPQRARRAARLRLATTLAQLRTAGPAERPRLLLAWQHDVARLWPLDHAAPPATALGDAAWAQLWAEADRTLYGAKSELPPDWVARAEAALAARKVPGFAWWTALKPAHLFPLLCLALLVVLVPSVRAATPMSSFRDGHFDEAEKGWREAVAQAPTDWIARHNLALALAQQERWQEAAAQATAAYVQNPRDVSARWNLALAYSKAGYTPTDLGPLLESNPLPDLARLASPAGWERELIVASLVAALALLGLIVLAYGIGPAWGRWPVLAVLVLAVLALAAGVAGRSAYGVAASPSAALAWRGGTLYSIPTEADTTQQTTTLPAGAMGTVDKTFLGWIRLSFPNGQTGWVRRDEVVMLWK